MFVTRCRKEICSQVQVDQWDRLFFSLFLPCCVCISWEVCSTFVRLFCVDSYLSCYTLSFLKARILTYSSGAMTYEAKCPVKVYWPKWTVTVYGDQAPQYSVGSLLEGRCCHKEAHNPSRALPSLAVREMRYHEKHFDSDVWKPLYPRQDLMWLTASSW